MRQGTQGSSTADVLIWDPAEEVWMARPPGELGLSGCCSQGKAARTLLTGAHPPRDGDRSPFPCVKVWGDSGPVVGGNEW